jgi:D-alanyl-D-alanine carboxypeptidase
MVIWAAQGAAPVLAAPYAAHVMDARTGETFYAKNADTRLHPASLTKMLTLYIAFDAIRRGEISLDTMVTVSSHAAAQPPSRLGLRPGQRIALRHLIRAAAIKSANDAATAIGDALSGNEAKFAARMNRTAKALGMKNSTFKNANGLTAAGHLSTARDMSVLGRRLFYDFPQYYNIFSRRETDAGVADVANTNRRFLDAYKGADGIKTGYTVAAGFNLTASAERDGIRLIATVFGGTSTANRNARMADLLDNGFAAAKKGVTVKEPAPVDLPAEPPPEAVAAAPGTAAKTIRLVTALKTSIRPRPRPAPGDAAATAAAVAALSDSIEDAVAAATDEEARAAPPPPAPAAEPPPPFAVVADVAPDAPDPASPLPFQVVDADGNPIADPALLPPPAAADDGAMASDAAPATEVAAADPATGVTPLAAAAPEEPLTVLLPLPEEEQVAAAEPEVITRLSTSGGQRNWGIALGRHASRGDAEKVLMKTMLTDSVALSDGLRKVTARSGGYDATVLGLSESQAALACRRALARAQDCVVLGP